MIHYIHKELLERVAVPVSAPCRIRHSAYLLPDDSLESREKVKVMFLDILAELGISQEMGMSGSRAGSCEKKFDDGNQLSLTWELHTEFYSFTTIHFPAKKPSNNFFIQPFTLPTFPVFGEKLVDLDVMVTKGLKLSAEQSAFLLGGNIYGGKVVDRKATLWTTFRVNEWGQERYVIGAGSLKPGRLGRLIRRVLEIENYYHLILRPLKVYREQLRLLREAEIKIVNHSEEIASGLAQRHPSQESEHKWLVNLTRDLADLIRLTERMRYCLSAANSYFAIFEERMLWLRVESDEGFQSYREFLNSRVSPVIRNYRNFIERSDVLTSQMTLLGNMMRTRVNLNMEEQGLKTMEAMNRRAALQLTLQKTVEGLSLIVLSYYMTGLANYIFKALKPVLPIPGNPAIWSALTIPLWLGLAFFITYRVKKQVKAAEKRWKTRKNTD